MNCIIDMDKMAVTPKGLKLLLAGLVVMIVGYILMIGGGSDVGYGIMGCPANRR